MNEGRKAPRERGNRSPIARARLAAGMTQGQLAQIIGCYQKDVSEWERGVQSPRVETLMKISAALGCKVDDLLAK